MTTIKTNPLGQATTYPETYDPALLYSVPRSMNRTSLGIIESALPFRGFDHWRAYELSWLRPNGMPVVATGDVLVSCDSTNIVESKSMKLYFNSLNQHTFASAEEARKCIQKDLATAAGGDVIVTIQLPGEGQTSTQRLQAIPENAVLLDRLNVSARIFKPDRRLLQLAGPVSEGAVSVTEVLASNLFRSNCPVTAQPDWGTVIISYTGDAIDHEGLLRYVISYRQHEGFHEHCAEQIYRDIMAVCAPEYLTVQINFLRRGGLEINPVRTSLPVMRMQPLPRLLRQ
ncbi:NADPH-dependent 7-cyano-7-deazaguanine reductase QueF [Pseudohongiella spirulinae]|uniref:7-cyano-7-deazaguanine reductase n=1 Tax=Pseudohongiella spirulinae TaxID=1249552 RepID=A0A0S2KCU0_9GAMM|nr:NADPH-dependent 7-cyano-7-deazaguanine reductase QueF [Pseudohongiella spirulinae]ALO46125.1 7-cyano-7-deazaguanine reductase [Pseudohongiella spirulinae]